jgi:uncharacterized protein YpmB
MKTLLILFVISFIGFVSAAELQDSTQNKNKEKEQVQSLEQSQQQNQNADDKIRNGNQNKFQDSGKDGKKRGKDVFIDKDGDGIADTRAGGMSLEKIRKRVRAGGKGGKGGDGNDGFGQGGFHGGK